MFLMKTTGLSSPVPHFLFSKETTFNSAFVLPSYTLVVVSIATWVFHFGHCMVTFPYGKWGLCTWFSSSTPRTINSHPHNIVTAQFWSEKYSGFTLLWLSMLFRHGAYMKLLFSYHHSLFLELVIFFLVVYIFLSVCFSCVCILCNYHSFNT